ncbi:MAG: PA2779 family protein [Gammaproteobacteria bacterium]|nr:PA2779 family protein [Gammaproteobacteria bacterium]
MSIFPGKRLCVLAVSVCLISLPLMQPGYASVISTEQAITLAERQGRIDHINEVLARDSVQNALVKFGVDPADASARVDALTDAELLTLEQQLGDLPAGGTGIVEVIGIVAIVLIVLELLNVTNFFTEF